MFDRRTLMAAAAAMAITSPTMAQDRVSDFKPFETGDIFVAATIMDNPVDDHMGTGRIFQYGSDLKLKGTLYTEGTKHKIGGLAFQPDGTLWAFAQGTPAIVEIGSDGIQKPVRKFSDRTLSSVTFGQDGSLYFGEHLIGKKLGVPPLTTRFNLLPGRDVIGDGWLFKFNSSAELLEEYQSEVHGGMAGIHGSTSTVLADNDTRMIYISETGNRVMQYDLANNKQLPDLKVFDEHDDIFMVLTMMPMVDGSLLISTGNGMVTLDQHTGEIIKYYDMDSGGWAACAPTADGNNIIVGNFFSGQIVLVSVETGEVVKSDFIGQNNSLSGVAQYPG